MAMSVIVVGGGKVGTHVASLLLAGGHRVRVIEMRREELPRLQADLPAEVVVIGSGTDPNVLEAAGIHQANVVAAVTGNDEVNLVVASLARFEFGISRIIGRVNNPKNAWLFTPQMGVDVALDQSDVMAHLVTEEMSMGDMMTLFKFRKGQYSLIEEKVHPQSAAAGKYLRDLQLPAECVIVAILRRAGMIIPHGDTQLEPADEVMALVHASSLPQLAALLGRQE